MSATATDPASTPGAMKTALRRELADGSVIEFEEAPVGYLKKDGEPRKAPWRAYFWTPPGGLRTRLPSVTTLLDVICAKPGLPPWAEAKGIEGAVKALHRGELRPEHSGAQAVEMVRALRLGADAARDEAAERGLDVHAFLEHYMRTGSPPSVGDYPSDQHGYVRAGARWLLKHRPEPLEIEQLVCDPQAGYAGRSDLVALCGGFRTRFDFKTSARAAIYSSSHLQIGLYERAAVACGDEPTDFQNIVVLAEDGGYRVMASAAMPGLVDAALAFYGLVRPVESLCVAANRLERKAREL